MSDLINSIALANIGPGKGKDFVSPTGEQFITAGPTREEIKARAPERGVMGAINDNVIEVANAAAGGVSSIANMVSPGNRVSKFIDEEIIKPGEAAQSDQVKAEKKFLQQDMANAQGAGDEITAYLGYMARNPGLAISQVAGSFAIPGLAAKGASRLAGAAGMGAGASSAVGLGSTSVVGGAMAGGDAAGSAYDLVKRTPKKILEQNSEYQELLQSMNPDQALEEIATRAARSASVAPAAIGAVLGPLGAERILAGAGRPLTASRAKNAFLTGGVDAGTEGFEEGVTQYSGQKAASQYDTTIDPMKGVAGAATAGAVMGAGPGLVIGALQTPAAPNPLQPVVDQASKPGSVLSRAVVSTGVADQPVTPPAGPDAGPAATQSSLDDPISARVALVESDLRINSTLEKIRGLTPEASSEFLYALNIAKNPNTRPDLRDQAITQVEQVLETAKSGTAFTMVPPEKQEPSTALTVPGQQGGDLATQQGGPLAPNGMGGFFDPNTVDVDAVRVDNMIGGPRAIEGPRARIGTNVSTEPQNIDTSEQRVAPVDTSVQANPVADSFAPEKQQTVAAATQAAPSTPAASAPEIPAVKPGAGGTYAGNSNLPAATRKRAATLRQLADQGFETVERRGNDFFLKNSKTGQELKLDGMADSQLARNQIQQSIRAQADQSPNSPRNDLKESTPAQNEAGNYTKPPVSLNGFSIRIENPVGSMRRGVDQDGVAWESEIKSDYGYIEGTKAADGDGVDVLIGNRSDANKIFVIDQVNEDGSFDEPKVVMGVTSEDHARRTYLANYEMGWTGLGAITEMTQEQFKDWLKNDGPMKPTALGKKPAASKPAEQPAPQAAPQNQPQGDQKARWIKAILDNSRLAGDTGIQLDVTPDGKLNFLGNPDSSKQGRSLLATLAEARKAGATDKEIADAIRASKRSKAEIPAPQGQYATLEEAKNYLSQQRRANGTVTGLPIQMADGSFGIAIKGSREYAEAERQRDEREGRNKSVKTDGEFFTVPDGGKQRKLKKVSKGSMPKKASPRRMGEPRELTQDEAGLIEQVAAVLGKTVVFYDDGGQRMGDGFFLPNQPGVLYVAKSTTVNPLAVFGHEFFHGLRETNPEAWNAIAAVVRTRVADPAGFRGDYSGKYVVRDASGRQVQVFRDRSEAEAFIKQSGRSGLVIGGQSAGSLTEQKGGELEELVSDLGGNLMMDPTFWRDVFAKVAEDNGPASKGIIARLAAALENLIARVMAAMAQPGFRANQFVTEAEAIRAAYKDGLANYIKASGTNKASMGAEVAKASQQIKKSPGRAAQPGAITVEGYHFSQEPRAVLNTMNFGTGLQGSARDEIMEAADERIKQRLSFYVDKGTGINPEAGVGAYAHKATLTNIYDGDADPLRLRGGDARAFESKVLDAGFSGYLNRMGGTQSGQVVLLGAQTVQPELLGTGPIKASKAVPAPAQRDEDLGDRLMANKSLPAGQLKPAAWADVLMASMPEDAAQLMDIGALSGDQAMFKDELAALARRLGGQIRKSTERAMSEYDAVVSQYKGTDQWLKAPDGTDTKLTERQWVQVRTPSFLKWFGDWTKGNVWGRDDVSKAVGANGEPLVVYHGTDKGGFTEFDAPTGKGRGDLGIWTTPDYGMARSYVRKGRARDVDLSMPTQSELEELGFEFIEEGDGVTVNDPQSYTIDGPADNDFKFRSLDDAIEAAREEFKGEPGAQPGVYALFINLRNPNEDNFEGAMWSGEVEDKVEVLDENGNNAYTSSGSRFFTQDEADALLEDNPDYEIIPTSGLGQTTDDVVRGALRDNADGAIIREVIDDGGGPGYFLDPQDIFVAFDPTQVKSADYNNGEFSDSTGDLRRSPRRREIPELVDAVTSVESAFEFAGSRVFATNRDFKLELQRRAREAAKDAKVVLNDQSQQAEDYLVRVGEKDALAGLKLNANAVGWYNEKVSKAMAVVSLIHPELKTNPEARFAFTWALAVTSNGLKVNKNFELAEMAYGIYKQTGRMPTNLKAGATQKKINESLSLFNELRAKWGSDALMDFMVSQDTVKSIKASSGVGISGEGQNTLVYGAAILGPKIGNGFFMNLYGRFDQLTMDRWLMRTWGRWTGTLIEIKKANIEQKRTELSGLIRLMNPAQRKEFQNIIGTKLSIGKIDETAELIQKASAKPNLREKMNSIGELDDSMRATLDDLLGKPNEGESHGSLGAEMRKQGNNLAKYLDGQKEAPGGSKERDFIRKVFGRVLARLKPSMPDLTMADLQAVVWYPEKRLYDAAKAEEDDADTGYADDEAPDYANAAVDLAKQLGVPADKIAAALKEIDDQLSANKLARDAGRGDRESSSAERTAAEETAATADEAGLPDGRGIRRSPERLDVSRGSDQGPARREQDGSLSGLPRDFTVAGEPIKASHWAPAEEVARQYMADAGLPYNPPAKYVKVDKDRAARIAAEYDRLEHNPQDPQVSAAYQALAQETIAQYQAVVDSGLEVEFIDFAAQGDPYAASPRLMTEDVRKNNHMWVFSTRDGFGSDVEFDPIDNPLLAETDFVISGKKALVNDLFRVVHDYFGHVKEGVGFRADGEENTWRSHSAMFSPLAQRALTTETRGQNSWVNYGPYGEQNRKADAGSTHYADQKVGLLPEWVSEEGRTDNNGPDGGGRMVSEDAGYDDGGIRFSPRRKPAPEKTVKAYKLFRMDKKKPGQLFPLFVDANTPVEINAWLDADIGEAAAGGKVKSKIGPLAFRPGWHAGDVPIATHIGLKDRASDTKPSYRNPEHVWAEIEMAADVDWQEEANKRATVTKAGKIDPKTAHITDQIPEDGFYRYKTNSNMTGTWLIGGSMKVNRVLSDAEVKRINKAAGVEDLPRKTPLDLKAYGFKAAAARKSADRSTESADYNQRIAALKDLITCLKK